MAKEAEIIIYALGGGMGHIVRAVSLAGAINRISSIEPVVLTIPEFAQFAKREIENVEIIEPSEDSNEYRSKIIDRMNCLSPKILVVDALPMGLMGELRDFLPAFTGKKVLIARILREYYRQVMDIENYVYGHYDLVIKSEKFPYFNFPYRKSIEVAPILARSGERVMNRHQARDKLKVPKDRILVMAVSTHQPLRADAFFQMVYHSLMRIGEERAVMKFASPYGEADPSAVHTSYFPLMELMAGIDIVVGHAGYHLVHETEALRVPFLCFPQERLYDDQQARIADIKREDFVLFKTAREVEDALRKIIGIAARRGTKPNFANGADDAAKAILGLR